MRIRLRRNGPYVVEGEVEVIGPDGEQLLSDRKPVALCRCGASARKPFCDGSHARVGFDGGGLPRADARSASDPEQS
jgi:CDGSH-type Zn-finger protein